MSEHREVISGQLLEEDMELTLAQLCSLCQVSAERVYELVDEGLVEPEGREPTQWRFRGWNIRRVRCAVRLQRDLGVNTAGAALVLELMEEVDLMRARLRRLSD